MRSVMTGLFQSSIIPVGGVKFSSADGAITLRILHGALSAAPSQEIAHDVLPYA